MILSLYAKGMTTRDIKEHLSEVYGASVSHDLISNVTDAWAQPVVAFDLDDSVGQDARRACDVDVG
jgi:putative transposase